MVSSNNNDNKTHLLIIQDQKNFSFLRQFAFFRFEICSCYKASFSVDRWKTFFHFFFPLLLPPSLSILLSPLLLLVFKLFLSFLSFSRVFPSSNLKEVGVHKLNPHQRMFLQDNSCRYKTLKILRTLQHIPFLVLLDLERIFVFTKIPSFNKKQIPKDIH